MRYGALTTSDPETAIEFFVTERPLATGAYILGKGEESPNVFVADSIAGLVMQIYPAIEQLEREGQRALGFPAMSVNGLNRMAERLTDSLIRRLSENADLWQEEPDWLDRLRPADDEA